ncbi:porin [Amphritea sp. HPY]|uniref:porin n=1 Tax=Amphritea sp. HPY TaxID=3421652 RepID=UPI003D7E9C92
MKKSIIALAVAGALTVPMVAQADATLYGSLRMKVVDADDTSLDVQDNASRIGIKGTSELFSGATAFFQSEFKAEEETGNVGAGRLAVIGVTGSYGTGSMGRQWTPHTMWTDFKTDILDHGSNPTADYGNAGRQSNTIAYITPDISGLKLAAVVIAADNGGSDTDDADAYNIAAHYTMGGFSVGASQVHLEAADDDINQFAASYSAGDLYVAALISDNETKSSDKQETFEVAGSYAFGNTKVLAQYVDFDESASQVALEVQQKLGAQARVFATVVMADSDAEAHDDASDSVAVGYRVDF